MSKIHKYSAVRKAKAFEGLIETLDILSDPTTLRSLRKAIRQPRAGKWLSYHEVFGPFSKKPPS